MTEKEKILRNYPYLVGQIIKNEDLSKEEVVYLTARFVLRKQVKAIAMRMYISESTVRRMGGKIRKLLEGDKYKQYFSEAQKTRARVRTYKDVISASIEIKRELERTSHVD